MITPDSHLCSKLQLQALKLTAVLNNTSEKATECIECSRDLWKYIKKITTVQYIIERSLAASTQKVVVA